MSKAGRVKKAHEQARIIQEELKKAREYWDEQDKLKKKRSDRGAGVRKGADGDGV